MQVSSRQRKMAVTIVLLRSHKSWVFKVPMTSDLRVILCRKYTIKPTFWMKTLRVALYTCHLPYSISQKVWYFLLVVSIGYLNVCNSVYFWLITLFQYVYKCVCHVILCKYLVTCNFLWLAVLPNTPFTITQHMYPWSVLSNEQYKELLRATGKLC